MKEKLVILHGWTKKESFFPLLPYLKDFDVYLIDLPGLDFKIERPYNYEDFLNYLEEKLKDLDEFYLLGHSFGGNLAMLYSLKHPEKIKTLILYAPALIREKNLKVKIIEAISKIFKVFEKILPHRLLYFLKRFFYRLFVGSYDYFLADDILKETMKNIYLDLREKAKELKIKTIIFWGEKDKITPFKHSLILKNLIKDSSLIPLEGGHSFHKEKPEEFAKVLKKTIFRKENI